MKLSPAGRVARVACLVVTASSLVRCLGPSDGPTALTRPNAAKASGGTGPAVTAVSPSYGYQGETGEQVTISGSGFDAGSTVAWERSGVVDPKIRPYNTVVVSSTQITTTIDIAADADLALYDVAVTTSSRKKGIGTEKFEVTSATPLTTLDGGALPRDVNSSGLVTGRGVTASGQTNAVLWTNVTDIVDIGVQGTAWSADELGTTLVGHSVNQSGVIQASIWAWTGSTWKMTVLPLDPLAMESRARTVTSDSTGAAVLIGGAEWYKLRNNQKEGRPRLWRRTDSGWERVELPTPTYGTRGIVHATLHGQAVGEGGPLYEFDGTGWKVTVLPGSSPTVGGITPDGTMVVGSSGGVAAYWRRQADGSWGTPVQLPGGCTRAQDVDASGRILVRECPAGGFQGAALMGPPYTTYTPLRGLGLPHESGSIEGMSNRGGWVVGSIGGYAVYWHMP